MKPFVIDIETGPRADAEAFLPPIEAPSNYKDQAKIDAYIAERRSKQMEEAALSAETAEILCVGLHDGENPFIVAEQIEAETLRATWDALGIRGANHVFVTFNGSRFDWPMLARRSYALGVLIPSWFPRDGRWPRRTHVDLFEWWQCGDRQSSISLDRMARLCGLPGKTDTGAQFATMWRENREKASAYLTKDLELTRDLFLRLGVEAALDVRESNDLPANVSAPTQVVQEDPPQPLPSRQDLLNQVLDLLKAHFPRKDEDKAARQAVLQSVFGTSRWPEIEGMGFDALRPRLIALRARLGTLQGQPPATNVIDLQPASTVQTPSPAAPPAPANPEPERQVEKQAPTEPAATAPQQAPPDDLLATDEATKIEQIVSDCREQAIRYCVSKKLITNEQSMSNMPFAHISTVNRTKILTMKDLFLANVRRQR